MANAREPVVVEQRDWTRPLVSIYNTVPQPNVRTGRLYEDSLRRHSKMIADHIDREIAKGVYTASADKTIHLAGISGGATLIIIDEIDTMERIRRNNPDTDVEIRIKVHNMPLEQGIAIWHALLTFDFVSPVQDQVERQLAWMISHSKTTPTGMLAVARATYEHRDNHGLWDILIHQLAYDLVHLKYTVAEIYAFKDATKTFEHDELKIELEAKIRVLGRQKEYRENHPLNRFVDSKECRSRCCRENNYTKDADNQTS